MNDLLLVAGSTGRVGGKICALRLAQGGAVRALVRPTSEPEKVERLQAMARQVRAAAAVQDARVKAETASPAPAGEGTIDPGKASTIDADSVGASVTFSGNKVGQSLQVQVGAAPKTASGLSSGVRNRIERSW